MESNINDVRKPASLTTELLRERLRGTALRDDPVDVSLAPEAERWPASIRDKLTAPLTPAGVLIPVMQRTTELSVLLTQRSAELKHHAGQVSFPGGRMEQHDEDVGVTALREAHEEVGIEPHHVSVIGFLDAMPTLTGYAVTPVVGLVSDKVELVIDRTEVEYAFEVPLAFVLDEANDRLVEREFQGRRFPMIEFHYEEERIWGATAQMLIMLRQYLMKQ